MDAMREPFHYTCRGCGAVVMLDLLDPDNWPYHEALDCPTPPPPVELTPERQALWEYVQRETAAAIDAVNNRDVVRAQALLDQIVSAINDHRRSLNS